MQDVLKSTDDPTTTKYESARTELLANKDEISFIDYGAGSKNFNTQKRRVCDVARSSLSSPKECRLMCRLVKKYCPQTMIELGTSLGIMSLYLSSGNHRGQLHTFEGNDSSAAIAQGLFDQHNAHNIQSHVGQFDEILPQVLEEISGVDLAVIDGNHTYQATIDYFHLLYKKSNRHSIFVFDDIYWSEGMTKAWEEIKAHPAVSLTIDLYDVGFVFFKEDVEKQNFTLIKYIKKPWRIGLFG